MAADVSDRGSRTRTSWLPQTEEVLRPVFTRYYNEESQTPAGDVIRGIDWLGNGGFVRNLIEKARDHRNNRLDTGELDALLATDSFDPPTRI